MTYEPSREQLIEICKTLRMSLSLFTSDGPLGLMLLKAGLNKNSEPETRSLIGKSVTYADKTVEMTNLLLGPDPDIEALKFGGTSDN